MAQVPERKDAIVEFNSLTPEQREKVNACKTPEEILALAKSEGYELSDEQLDDISGGWKSDEEAMKDLAASKKKFY